MVSIELGQTLLQPGGGFFQPDTKPTYELTIFSASSSEKHTQDAPKSRPWAVCGRARRGESPYWGGCRSSRRPRGVPGKKELLEWLFGYDPRAGQYELVADDQPGNRAVCYS